MGPAGCDQERRYLPPAAGRTGTLDIARPWGSQGTRAACAVSRQLLRHAGVGAGSAPHLLGRCERQLDVGVNVQVRGPLVACRRARPFCMMWQVLSCRRRTAWAAGRDGLKSSQLRHHHPRLLDHNALDGLHGCLPRSQSKLFDRRMQVTGGAQQAATHHRRCSLQGTPPPGGSARRPLPLSPLPLRPEPARCRRRACKWTSPPACPPSPVPAPGPAASRPSAPFAVAVADAPAGSLGRPAAGARAAGPPRAQRGPPEPAHVGQAWYHSVAIQFDGAGAAPPLQQS